LELLERELCRSGALYIPPSIPCYIVGPVAATTSDVCGQRPFASIIQRCSVQVVHMYMATMTTSVVLPRAHPLYIVVKDGVSQSRFSVFGRRDSSGDSGRHCPAAYATREPAAEAQSTAPIQVVGLSRFDFACSQKPDLWSPSKEPPAVAEGFSACQHKAQICRKTDLQRRSIRL
jgi:hypothetical protein